MADGLQRLPVDDLLDRAIDALNRGDVAHAHDLATEVLAAEAGNVDAGDLLAAKARPEGELRRLTVMFCDLVGSTKLSSRLEPEAYRAIVVRYQDLCRSVIEGRYEGTIVSYRGDGVLASFGFPVAHENDVDRALLAGLDLLDGIERLARDLAAEGSDRLHVRVAVHRGLVFLDHETKDLYGFAVNVAARLEGLAEVGTLLVSDEVGRLVADRFDLLPHPPRVVKGVAGPIATHTVLDRRSGASPRTARAPLVGRDDELAVLRAVWTQAQAGERAPGSCVAVVGEAGIGKSRLVEALVHEVRADAGTVVTLHGSPLHTGIGLWPVRALVEDRAGFTRQLDGPARLGRLEALSEAQGLPRDSLPLLAALLGLDPDSSGYDPDESDARRLRDRIADAALGLLESCIGRDGTVILAEDVHWFDDETRDLLARLLRRPDPRTTIVLTSRDPSDAPRTERTVRVELGAMDGPARLELLRELGGAALDAPRLAQLAEQSDGIPLYLEELARAALYAAERPSADVALPDTPAVPEVLYEPLVARLQGAAHGLALATTAATIGREADRDLLRRVSDLEPGELEEAILELLGALVLERAAGAPERYRFRHELLRAVAYDLQPPSRRRDLHARVADALRADAAGDDAIDWAVVAGHYETAGRVRDAADAYDRAALVARRRGALAEARALLGNAIELVAAAPEDLAEKEVELRLQRGFLAVSLEGNSSAVAATDYERCLELSLPLGDSDAMFSTLLAIWSYRAARAEFDRADELLDVLGRIGGPRAAVAHLFSVGGRALVAMWRGDHPRALALAEEAVGLSATLPGIEDYDRWWYIPIDPIASYASMPATIRVLMGDPSGHHRAAEASRAAVAALPFPQGQFTHGGVLCFDVWMSLEVGDLERAQASLDELVELSARYGFDQWAILAATQRAVFEGHQLLARELDAAARSALAGHAATLGVHLGMWKLADQWVAITYYLTMQGVFSAAAGDRAAALACFEEALTIAARTGMRFYDPEALRHLANLQESREGRLEGLRTSIAAAREQGMGMFEVRAAADLHDLTGDLGPLADAVGRIPGAATYPELEAARALLT